MNDTDTSGWDSGSSGIKEGSMRGEREGWKISTSAAFWAIERPHGRDDLEWIGANVWAM